MLVEYDGIKLYKEELAVLSEFEKLLGKRIPQCEGWNINYHETGYLAVEGYIFALSIYDEQLDSIPKNIGNLKSLEILSLSKNNLTTIPEQIGSLKRLKELRLYKNKLSYIHPNIGNLKVLESLDISANNLNSLPESIGNLKSLKYLYASHNKITFLPKTIEKLNLGILQLRHNRLDDTFIKLDLSKINTVVIDENFLLNFNYYPSIYNKIEDNRKNSAIQKENFTVLINDQGLRDYYWEYIITNNFDTFDVLETIRWDFDIYMLEENMDYDFNELSSFKKFLNTRIVPDKIEPPWFKKQVESRKKLYSKRLKKKLIKTVKHPSRKNNFLELALVINFYDVTPEQYDIIKYLCTLIKSITITVKSNRGDLVSLVFTDFYFRKTPEGVESIAEHKIPNLIFFTTSYLKFDPEYKMEPYARLMFTDIKVEYEKLLMPGEEEMNIRELNKKVEKLISFIEKSPKKSEIAKTHESDMKEREDKQQFNKKVMEIMDKFRRGYKEPVFPDIILEIGKRFSGNIGKFVEYLAAGIIFASALPGLLQFFLGLRIDSITGELITVDLPALLELLTYLPLAFLIIFLLIKFLLHQRVPKE